MSSGKYELYYVYDSPVPYKNLLIYPATVKDYFQFYTFAQCLLLDKNAHPDPSVIAKVISMTYLEYLYFASTEENPYILYLDLLLKLVLRKQEDKEFKIDYGYNEKGKPVFVIGNELFNSEDFENIRDIICEYNSLELPDLTIQKEIRDMQEHTRRLKAEQNDKMAGLEDLMVCISVATNYKIEEIYGLSIRKFVKLLERINMKLDYQIYKTASMSGFVKFDGELKELLKHWMRLVEKNKLEGLQEYETVSDRMSFRDKMK